MVRPDSIAPNEVKILMPLVSELTARDSLLADPWLGSLADTGCRLCGQGGSAHLFRRLLRKIKRR
jgi:hypothetical protein